MARANDPISRKMRAPRKFTRVNRIINARVEAAANPHPALQKDTQEERAEKDKLINDWLSKNQPKRTKPP